MVDTSRKPYVRYRIQGKTEDRGVGFAIKQAVQTFIKSHGYEARVVGFNATSDSFSADLELYDNGKLDFNARTLYEHILNSGRMPTTTKKRPTLEISPLPCDYCVEEGPRDYEGLAKTIEKLGDDIRAREKEIKSRDATISSLTKSLGERQKSLDSIQRRVEELEVLLDKSIPAQHDDPLSALWYHYLSRHAETVSEALNQWDNLDSGERELFLKLGTEQEISYLGLFNEVTGTNFQSDSEFRQWQEHWKSIISGGKDGLLSDKEKELQKRQEEQTTNLGILDLAKQNGASPELIQSVQKVIEQRKHFLSALEEAVAQEQQDQAREKEAYLKLNEVEAVYNKISELFTYSVIRAEEGKILPVIVVRSGAGQPVVNPTEEIYCPFIPIPGKETPFILQGLIRYLLDEGKAESISLLEELPEGIIGWSVQYNNSAPTDTEQKVKDYLAACVPELKALGLEPKVVSLQLQSL